MNRCFFFLKLLHNTGVFGGFFCAQKLVSCHVTAGDNFPATHLYSIKEHRHKPPPGAEFLLVYCKHMFLITHANELQSPPCLSHTHASFTSTLSVEELKLPATSHRSKSGKAGRQKCWEELQGEIRRGGAQIGKRELFRDKQRRWGGGGQVEPCWLCSYFRDRLNWFLPPQYLLLPRSVICISREESGRSEPD